MRFAFPIIVLSVLCAAQPAAAQFSDLHANQDSDRTVKRTVPGVMPLPDKYFKMPEHSEFLPGNSNHHPQHDHPQQWAGQDWDPKMWNEKQWTPEIAIGKLYQNRTFNKAYVRNRKIPVLEVGPTFYKLSGLDQRRAVKLITDHDGVFDSGFEMVELRDWQDRSVIGSYTKQGLILN